MNLFRVLASGKHAVREEFVSAYLAYLLSPKMDHGLGYSFLSRLGRTFCDRVLVIDESGLTNDDIEFEDLLGFLNGVRNGRT